jgi:hypothetical protein
VGGSTPEQKEAIMKNIKDLIEKHTKDEKTDWDAVEEAINKETNDIVAKQTSKAQADLLKDLGFDDKDDLTAQLGKVEELNGKVEELQGAKTETERKLSLINNGVKDEDDIDYVMFQVNKRVDDETKWEDALKAYKEEKPSYFGAEKQKEKEPEKPPVTGTKQKSDDKESEPLGYERILAEKHPEVFNKN